MVKKKKNASQAWVTGPCMGLCLLVGKLRLQWLTSVCPLGESSLSLPKRPWNRAVRHLWNSIYRHNLSEALSLPSTQKEQLPPLSHPPPHTELK